MPHLRGDKNPAWKGGRSKMALGYIRIRLQPDDFFYSMTDKDSWVLEHRLVMAKHLNRCLLSWEVVHHLNSVRDDNRLENLELIKGRSNHMPFNLLQQENKRLKKRVEVLEAELRRIRNH